MQQRFLIVEDHPMLREAVRQTLLEIRPEGQITTVGSLAEALGQNLRETAFDLVIVDLDLPDSTGLATLRAMRANYADQRTAVFSGRQDSTTILRCLESGACGFMPKSMHVDAVRHALQLMLAGDVFVPPQAVGSADTPRWSRPHLASNGDGIDPRSLGLTERQIAVLRLILRGLPNKLICRDLNLAEGTIKVHVSAVLRVLGVRNRTQAIIAARELGLKLDDDAMPAPARPGPLPAVQPSFASRPLA